METDLTELEQRIVSDLEEADASIENVFAIANSVISATGASSEVLEVVAALRRLLERGFILMGLETIDQRPVERFNVPNSLRLIDDLPGWFRYSGLEPHWTLNKGDFRTCRYPVACLTEHGKLRAREILESRGFRWWVRK